MLCCGVPQVLEFIVARLTSWGSLMGLFPEGLPPIQNPAQPGCIEAWQGRPVVWATWLVYPGRPSGLLRGLGLTRHSSVCFRWATGRDHAGYSVISKRLSPLLLLFDGSGHA